MTELKPGISLSYQARSSLSGIFYIHIDLTGHEHRFAVSGTELTQAELDRYMKDVPRYIETCIIPGWDPNEIVKQIVEDIDEMTLDLLGQLNRSMKINELIAKSAFDKKAKPVKLRGIFDKENLNIGAGTKVSAQTVVVKDTKTGVISGRRTLYQK